MHLAAYFLGASMKIARTTMVGRTARGPRTTANSNKINKINELFSCPIVNPAIP
jgi:hypothetical protein